MLQKIRFYLTAIGLLCGINVMAQQTVEPLPTPHQVAWQEMETYAFIHYGLNTYTDKEWGYGDADPKVFNPQKLDCEQWVRVLQQGGMKGVILTAKHHDGFCLWPTKYTDYNITATPFRGGKGDLVRELSEACKKYGMKFGLYLSPWDRHQATYGTPAYVEYYNHQLEELLTQYGPLFEIWFDGANGGDGWYGGANEKRQIDRTTYYNFPVLNAKVYRYQPQAIIFSDGGPGCRWVGNENGFAGETNWAFLRGKEVYPGYPKYQELPHGHADGYQWTAAECDVSIRPGWFYHDQENDKVKTPEELREIYYKSVGRNATMLLNVPVNKEGLISAVDSAHLVQFAQLIREDFKNNLLEGRQPKKKDFVEAGNPCQELVYKLRGKQTVNCIMLGEDIATGQRVKSFRVEYKTKGGWMPIDCQEEMTTIGYKRILRFPAVQTKQIRVVLQSRKGAPIINKVGLYKI